MTEEQQSGGTGVACADLAREEGERSGHSS